MAQAIDAKQHEVHRLTEAMYRLGMVGFHNVPLHLLRALTDDIERAYAAGSQKVARMS